MDFKEVSDYHERYGEWLCGYGFQRAGDSYWRVYGDANFQLVQFQKMVYPEFFGIKLEDIDVNVFIYPLYMPYLPIGKGFQVMEDGAWLLYKTEFRHHYELRHGHLDSKIKTPEIEDAILGELFENLQQADTAEHTYEICRKFCRYESEEELLEENTGLREPEILDHTVLYWLALRSEQYAKCREYNDFDYQLQFAIIRDDILTGLEYAEADSIRRLSNQADQWYLNRNTECFARENRDAFLKYCEANIKKQRDYLNSDMISRETVDYQAQFRAKICKAGFKEKNGVFWRFYGDQEIQVLQFEQQTGDRMDPFLRIGTYPLYSGAFLSDMLQCGEENFFRRVGIWDVEKHYESIYGKQVSPEQAVEFALTSLERADTAEHAYELWKDFLWAQDYTKICDYVSKLYWPECLSSPMVYYQLRMKSHEKIKDFLRFWKKCLKKGDDENHFPEDYRNISSAYRYAKHGKWNFIEKKLEENCIENRKIMLKTLGN